MRKSFGFQSFSAVLLVPIMVFNRTAVLVILDGFGVNPDKRFNAFAHAEAPVLKSLLESCPNTTLEASEHFVGLPPGFMGNSEVGHLNIGAGRVVYQDFSLISKAISDDSFYKNPAFVNLLQKLKGQRHQGTLHLMGLVSDGGVHSHISHLFALLQMAKREQIEDIAIHIFTDGRDTPPISGVEFVGKVKSFVADLGVGRIASVSGRFYAMDRDSRWERTESAYRALVLGNQDSKTPTYSDPVELIRASYEKGVTDEFIVPAISKNYKGIKEGDGIIFFNFRADRARQITRALTQTDFAGFRREGLPTLSGYVCMTPYDEKFGLPCAFEKVKVPNTLGEVVRVQILVQANHHESQEVADMREDHRQRHQDHRLREEVLHLDLHTELKHLAQHQRLSDVILTELKLQHLMQLRQGIHFLVNLREKELRKDQQDQALAEELIIR
jgi:2,3-bisphosphoglycerate-independent phosphoglycerate mutase